jgi:hypothetical protein
VIKGNFFSQSFADATVVSIYQGESINERLKTKLADELKPGTRLVSYSFPFEGWSSVETIENPDIYLYII